MSPEQKKTCTEFSSLVVKKATGEILAHEQRALELHLAQCASCAVEERQIIGTLQKLDSLPEPVLPRDLYESTRQAVLVRLQQENSRSAWFKTIPNPRRALIPVGAGLAMTAVSYGLIHRLIDPGVQHYYPLLPLFGIWWMLFAGGCWSILKPQGRRESPINLISASSISIALLTLLMSFLAFELEPIRWMAMSASYEIARATEYFFGIGNTFVTAWWVHCCLASFIGAFVFGVSRSSHSSENMFVGSFVVMILVSPAIYLQGASHNHGLGIIVFAAVGTYVGSLVGMGLGLLIRRKLSFQTA